MIRFLDIIKVFTFRCYCPSPYCRTPLVWSWCHTVVLSGHGSLGTHLTSPRWEPFFKLLTTDDGILAGSPDAASQPLGAGHSHPPAHLACDRLQQADQAQVPPHVAATFFQIFTSQLSPCIQLDQEAEEKEGRGGVACRWGGFASHLSSPFFLHLTNPVTGTHHYEGGVLQQYLIS